MVLFQFIARSLPSQYKAKFFNIILRLPKDRINFLIIFNNLKGRLEAVCLTINFFRTYHCSLVGQLHFQISLLSVSPDRYRAFVYHGSKKRSPNDLIKMVQFQQNLFVFFVSVFCKVYEISFIL